MCETLELDIRKKHRNIDPRRNRSIVNMYYRLPGYFLYTWLLG